MRLLFIYHRKAKFWNSFYGLGKIRWWGSGGNLTEANMCPMNKLYLFLRVSIKKRKKGKKGVMKCVMLSLNEIKIDAQNVKLFLK